MQAATKEVVSKPTRVKWSDEVFDLHFSPDGSEADYSCVYPPSKMRGTLKRQLAPVR